MALVATAATLGGVTVLPKVPPLVPNNPQLDALVKVALGAAAILASIKFVESAAGKGVLIGLGGVAILAGVQSFRGAGAR